MSNTATLRSIRDLFDYNGKNYNSKGIIQQVRFKYKWLT